MSYWKGLMLAAAIDLVWIMGCPFMISDPEPRAGQAIVWQAEPSVDSATFEGLSSVARMEDSLMLHLQSHPRDVSAMEQLARLYMANDWYDRALGPLTRALQIDPAHHPLWVELDRAIEKSGRQKITDAELTTKAKAFVEAVEMWGQGC